jgi:tRNA(Phe) wybutosine-synthesizing methylase Tyw3
MQDLLPSPPASFTEKKKKILQQLSIPDSEYTDASPKGSVDEGIKDLIAELNTADGIVTTSSCAGRVSVFVEGRKTAELSEDGQVAGVGGKGAGGKWLFVSHDPVPSNSQEWIGDLQLMGEESQRHCCDKDQEKRLIHFKFEPMVSFQNRTLAMFDAVLLHEHPYLMWNTTDPSRSHGVAVSRTTSPPLRFTRWLPRVWCRKPHRRGQ